MRVAGISASNYGRSGAPVLASCAGAATLAHLQRLRAARIGLRPRMPMRVNVWRNRRAINVAARPGPSRMSGGVSYMSRGGDNIK